jgi:hypothetical protein
MTVCTLIPPDPNKTEWYWLKTRDGRIFSALWSPYVCCWTFGNQRGAGHPTALINYGYTFASDPPRPIPSPAALERLYAAAGAMHSQKEAAMRMCNRYVVGTVDYERESTRASAYADAADILRAALEDR